MKTFRCKKDYHFKDEFGGYTIIYEGAIYMVDQLWNLPDNVNGDWDNFWQEML